MAVELLRAKGLDKALFGGPRVVLLGVVATVAMVIIAPG